MTRSLHPDDYMTYRLDDSDDYGVYDVDKLVRTAKRQPTKRLPLKHFANAMSNKNVFAEMKGGRVTKPLSPNDVLAGKGGERGAMHRERASRANTKYPIVATPDGTVVDGLHRLMKAKEEGRKTIPTKVLPAMPDSALVRVLKLRGAKK